MTNLRGGADSVFGVMPLNTSAANHTRAGERVPVRIDFDRPEGEAFNAEGLLKPGLSAESEVCVRWFPQVQ